MMDLFAEVAVSDAVVTLVVRTEPSARFLAASDDERFAHLSVREADLCLELPFSAGQLTGCFAARNDPFERMVAHDSSTRFGGLVAELSMAFDGLAREACDAARSEVFARLMTELSASAVGTGGTPPGRSDVGLADLLAYPHRRRLIVERFGSPLHLVIIDNGAVAHVLGPGNRPPDPLTIATIITALAIPWPPW